VNPRFRMLSWAAGGVEGTGWICVIVGVVAIVNGLSSCSHARSVTVESVLSFLTAAIPLVVGELLILMGQAGKCFLAIEENTRHANAAINALGAPSFRLQGNSAAPATAGAPQSAPGATGATAGPPAPSASFDETTVSEFRRRLADCPTDNLLKMRQEGPDSYSPEAFEAVRRLLAERGL
jgi:hypothetical protein